MKTTEFKSYESFLQNFIDVGYEFKTFENFEHGKDRQIILRHDVDFDIEYAGMMAIFEMKLKIKSTYFIMFSSSLYNPLSYQNANILFDMTFKFGHKLGIHFDAKPYEYDDNMKGFLEQEKDVLKRNCWNFTNIISIHRPPGHPICEKIDDEHTYKPKWFRDIEYISDSKGYFREGNPFESDWFKQGKSCQCNIHPIWWMQEGKDSIEKIRNWIKKKNKRLIDDVCENSEPYRNYLEEL